MKLIKFELLDNLSKYTDSMLFDSNTVIAKMVCEHKGHTINVGLMVRGYVKVEYKGDIYTNPSDFPEELRNTIEANPNLWMLENDDVEIWENNWFEYIYDHSFNGRTYSDGIMFEDDLSKYTAEELEKAMLEICKYIVEC